MPSTPPDGSPQVTSKPYHAKRPHRKARTGCVNCKRRKVKCNEGRPSCSACLNRREDCEYRQATPSQVRQQRPSQQDVLLQPQTPSPPQPHPLLPFHTQPKEPQRYSYSIQKPTGALSRPAPPQQRPLPSGPLLPVLSILQRLYLPSKFQKLTEAQKLEQFSDVIEFERTVSRYLKHCLSQEVCFDRNQNQNSSQGRIRTLCELLDKLLCSRKMRLHGTQLGIHSFYTPQFSSIETHGHLIQHFQLHTSTSFNVDPINRRYSDGILQEIATNYSFESASLMNCVLALSALHIKRKEIAGDPALISLLAHEYIDASTSQILADMEVADPSTLPHLVVASLLMTAISSEQFRDERFGANLFILNWMKIWSGIGIMMERITVPGLIQCGLSSLFYRPPLNIDASDDNIPEVLQAMVGLHPDDPEDHAVYRETLRYLGALYYHLKSGLSPMMRLRIITWITFVPSEFVQLALERRWKALVIVAHYAVFLKLTARVWWMENVGQRSIEDLVAFICPQKLQYLLVPVAAMQTDAIDEIGRLLLEDETWEQKPLARMFTAEEMLQFETRDIYVDRERATVPGRSGRRS